MQSDAAPPCGHDRSTAPVYEGEDRLYGLPGRFWVVRCTTCGLGHTLPRLGPEDLEAYYPPDAYVPYQEIPVPTNTRERVGARIDATRFSAGLRLGAFRALTRTAPGRLLDVGCGRGDLAAWFAGRGWEVAGVEPSADAARQAAGRGLEIHHGTLDDAPWGRGGFDAITFNHALEHVPDPMLTLRQTRELLRPGGLLVVSVPNFRAWQRRLFGSAWFPLDLPRHLQHFDRVSLPGMARAAGLEPVEVRTTSLLAGFLSSVQYALKGRLFLSAATMNRGMHLLFPLILIADLILREADCLHVVALRPVSSAAG